MKAKDLEKASDLVRMLENVRFWEERYNEGNDKVVSHNLLSTMPPERKTQNSLTVAEDTGLDKRSLDVAFSNLMLEALAARRRIIIDELKGLGVEDP